MSDKIDIVALIENNPLMKLSGDYQGKFIEKIKNKFSEEEQSIFVASFYLYLNNDSKTDFVIELDSVWKWLGFSRKDHCKVVLEKNFTTDIDYKVSLEVIAPATSGALKVRGCAGQNKEKILLNINTFKKLCLKSNTKKADEIHDYFIKLEEIVQETLEEQSNEFATKLRQRDEQLNQRDEQLLMVKDQLKNIQEQKDIGWFYIAIDDALKNITKIGISKDAIRRREQHTTSNIKFTYIFTHKSENYKDIEKMVKIMCKKHLVNKDKTQSEWYNLNSEEVKMVFDFACMMYDEYSIYSSKDQLLDFVNRWKKNRVSQNTNKTFYTDDEYDSFFREHIIFGDDDKTPYTLIEKDFIEWVTDSDKIKTPSGNTCTKFIDEFMKNIERFSGSEKSTINLLDSSRNYNYSKYPGFIGFELKSMKGCLYNFYSKEQYNLVLLGMLEKAEHNVDNQSVIKKFINCCDTKGFTSKKPLYKNTNIVTSFKQELKREILSLFPESRYCNVRSKNYNTSGYKNLCLK